MAKEVYPRKMGSKKDRISSGNISRRKFVGGIIVASTAATLLPSHLYGRSISDDKLLSNSQYKLISSVQNILFPSDKNGPGAYDIMADKYLEWVLSDIRMDPKERGYIIVGISWVNETSDETYSVPYNKLSQEQKENLIASISKEKWGISWLGVILNFIFEALLSDPQYGSNPKGIGWEWLQHNTGFPRPTAELLYPKIIETVSKNN